MPPKKKKRSKSMPKQSQSQRQSVVVNIGTSKTKSKPRKSRGRGGLPPPSYQHNLAPTFVTQQATDYNPVIGAIASLTSRLQQEPRIQNPVTPLSSTVQATSQSTQQAQAMAGQMAEERRDGPTAGNFQSPTSQADERLAQETQDTLDVQDEQAFEQNVSSGGGQVSGGGGQYPSIGKLAAGGDEKIPEADARALLGRRPKYIQQAIPVNPPQQAQAEEPKQKKKKPPAGQKDVDNLFKRQSKK
jgi:hypothetical protein